MTWYHVEIENPKAYVAYIKPDGKGLWIKYDKSTDVVENVSYHTSLYDEKELQEIGVKVPQKISDKIMNNIVDHPTWSAMLIKQIFYL